MEKENTIDAPTLLARWAESFLKMQVEYDKLKDVLDISPESKMSVAIFNIFEEYTKALSFAIGDNYEWLEWYCWENDMGEKGLEAKASNWDEFKSIKNLEDLLSLIVNE